MLFENITVLRADGTAAENRFVAVEAEHIAAVSDRRPEGDWGETVDGRGKLLLPGFVNSHTHAAMTLLRGCGDDMSLHSWLHDRIFPLEARMSGEDVYWGTLLGIAEMLAGGTTSFSDMYYFTERVAQAVTESGIKANLGVSFSCTDSEKRLRDLPVQAELIRLLTQVHGAGDGRVAIDVAPHSEYTTHPGLLRDAAELAAAYGARMQMHLSETRREQWECVGRHGMTPAALLRETGILEQPVTLAHGVWLTESDMDLLAEHKTVTLAHCPKSNLKLASGIAQTTKWRRKGIAVAIGTDSAASNNTLDMLEELRMASLLAKGISGNPCALPAQEVLYMATRAGALAQGRRNCGDIVPGYRADLVMLDAADAGIAPCDDPLSAAVYAASGRAVELTMVDGQVLYRAGEYPLLDMARVRWECGRIRKQMTGKG